MRDWEHQKLGRSLFLHLNVFKSVNELSEIYFSYCVGHVLSLLAKFTIFLINFQKLWIAVRPWNGKLISSCQK